ncbi:MAG: ABC transporter ATP-binding protein [Acetobacteraceae bacterium]|nr:ABC transporter ATP-binding protein [Acetobacteraceae bacterium]
MAQLVLDGVGRRYGEIEAIRDISLAIEAHEFMAILGPSGCGKSTLLQIAAGLLPASFGRVLLDGAAVTAPPRSVVYLFQHYSRSLLPWRSVLANVAFAIEHRGFSRTDVRERAMHHIGRVGLEKFATKYPWQLSGGMQQRVAIARALTAEPRVLMMDEPFSSVDALTRLDLQALIQEIRLAQPMTVLLVTHDVDEAVYMADRIAVLTHRPGELAELIEVCLDRPRDAIGTREQKRFLELRHHLLSMLLRRQDAA